MLHCQSVADLPDNVGFSTLHALVSVAIIRQAMHEIARSMQLDMSMRRRRSKTLWHSKAEKDEEEKMR